MSEKIRDINSLDGKSQMDIQTKGEMFWVIMMTYMSSGKGGVRYLQLTQVVNKGNEWSQVNWSDRRDEATRFTNLEETTNLYKRVAKETRLPISLVFCGWILDKGVSSHEE